MTGTDAADTAREDFIFSRHHSFTSCISVKIQINRLKCLCKKKKNLAVLLDRRYAIKAGHKVLQLFIILGKMHINSIMKDITKST
jgi:hypothetical protein